MSSNCREQLFPQMLGLVRPPPEPVLVASCPCCLSAFFAVMMFDFLCLAATLLLCRICLLLCSWLYVHGVEMVLLQPASFANELAMSHLLFRTCRFLLSIRT